MKAKAKNIEASTETSPKLGYTAFITIVRYFILEHAIVYHCVTESRAVS